MLTLPRIGIFEASRSHFEFILIFIIDDEVSARSLPRWHSCTSAFHFLVVLSGFSIYYSSLIAPFSVGFKLRITIADVILLICASAFILAIFLSLENYIACIVEWRHSRDSGPHGASEEVATLYHISGISLLIFRVIF